jgi:hypothetical protein
MHVTCMRKYLNTIHLLCLFELSEDVYARSVPLVYVCVDSSQNVLQHHRSFIYSIKAWQIYGALYTVDVH